MSALRKPSLESHAHRLAKVLMATWLREAAEHAGIDGGASFCQIGWRVNRPGPHWGVWMEYPFVQGKLQVWDECGNQWRQRPPSFDELQKSWITPNAIVDIAIQHKGRISWAIEIVHKHPVDEDKRAFIENWTNLTLLEIPAYWVLGQCDVPAKIPEEFFLTW